MMLTSFPRHLAVAIAAASAWASPATAVVGPSSSGGALAPYVVMVLQRSGAVAGFCSGVVLAPRVVLTAAHCARAGADLRIHFRDDAGKPVLLPVAAVARHPGYRPDAIRTRRRSIDLALIRLPNDLPQQFRPAALGTAMSTGVGTAFRIAGFGVTRENDGTSSGQLRVATLEARAPLSSVLLWARDPSGRGGGACTGDSGGPVLDAAGDTVEALTVWSAGDGSAGCGALTQALWLAPQRGWIDGTLAGWGLEP